jgi:CRP-like cAMP-binding protein
VPTRQESTRSANHLLAALPADELHLLSNDLERVETVLGQSIARENENAEWVFFPDDAVMSMVRILEDGSMIEVGVVGFDGLVGLQTLTGKGQPYRVVVQNAGATWRMPIQRFRDEFRNGGKFQEAVLRFSASFLLQVSQTAACNRVHTIGQRLARWLLMMRDRTTSDELALTQEFLSHMLGVRVAGVNEAVGTLVLSGLVKHSRGHIEIVDRDGLELAACECYRAVKNESGFPA